MNVSLFLQNLLQSLRGLRRTGWQSAVSVLGLLVGMVSLTLSANWLWTETHYDRFRPGYRDLYVADFLTDGYGMRHFSYLHLGEMKQALQGSEAQLGFWQETTYQPTAFTAVGDSVRRTYGRAIAVDSIALELLQLRPIAGAVERLCQSPKHVVLTRSMATSLFGSPEAAVGRLINTGRQAVCTVVAVVEDGEQESNLYYDCLEWLDMEFYQRQPNGRFFRLLVRTNDPEHTCTLFPPMLTDGHKGEPIRVVLTPLSMAHKLDGQTPFVEAYFYPLAFVALSALLLLSALVNLVMACTSLFLGRTREYALRRSLGASALQCDAWMLTELWPVVGAAALFGTVALEWLGYGHYVPGYADRVLPTYGWVLLATLAVLLMAMVYPLWLMRRSYRRSFAGVGVASSSHAYLLVVQCFACALLLFLSWGMQRRLSGMLHDDLGFARENILRLYTGFVNYYADNEPPYYGPIVHDLPAELRKEVGAGITDAILMPADLFNRLSSIRATIVTEEVLRVEEAAGMEPWYEFYHQPAYEKYLGISLVEIPYDAVRFFNLRTRFGKGFITEGLAAGEWSVMLNPGACKLLGIDRPGAGLILRDLTSYSWNYTDVDATYHFRRAPLRVCDVAEVRLTDFHQPDEPLVIFGVPEQHKCSLVQHEAVYIKYAPGRRADAEAAVRRVLKKKLGPPAERIRLESLQDHVAYTYQGEIYCANLLTAVTAFSVLITFSGVFSLLLYSLRLRRRSMAIRRVMGASFGDVLRSTLWPYLCFTLLGGALAYAPAFYFMRGWMEYFHYGEAPGAGFMALIVGGMVLVVFLMVYLQVRRAMNEKPVEVLRPEA